MKRNVLRGLRSSLLLFLWLLLVQFISSLLSIGVILILGINHPVGPTPLWVWIIDGVLICLFWLVMGMVTPDVVQLRLAGVVAMLMVWAILTSLMRNVYLLFLPQKTCGGMLRQILQFLRYNSAFLLDEYQDLPIGCFLLSVTFGVGVLLRQKRTKAINKMSEGSA